MILFETGVILLKDGTEVRLKWNNKQKQWDDKIFQGLFYLYHNVWSEYTKKIFQENIGDEPDFCPQELYHMTRALSLYYKDRKYTRISRACTINLTHCD